MTRPDMLTKPPWFSKSRVVWQQRRAPTLCILPNTGSRYRSKSWGSSWGKHGSDKSCLKALIEIAWQRADVECPVVFKQGSRPDSAASRCKCRAARAQHGQPCRVLVVNCFHASAGYQKPWACSVLTSVEILTRDGQKRGSNQMAEQQQKKQKVRIEQLQEQNLQRMEMTQESSFQRFVEKLRQRPEVAAHILELLERRSYDHVDLFGREASGVHKQVPLAEQEDDAGDPRAAHAVAQGGSGVVPSHDAQVRLHTTWLCYRLCYVLRAL